MILHANITPEDLRELQQAADCAGLEMEFLELRANAARYEWLRAHFASVGIDRVKILCDKPEHSYVLDAAIDAAMAAK